MLVVTAKSSQRLPHLISSPTKSRDIDTSKCGKTGDWDFKWGMWAVEKDHLGADDWLKGVGIENENMYRKLLATDPSGGGKEGKEQRRDEDQNEHCN